MATNNVTMCVSCKRMIPAGRNICPVCGATATYSAQQAYPQQAAVPAQAQYQQAYARPAAPAHQASYAQARPAVPAQAQQAAVPAQGQYQQAYARPAAPAQQAAYPQQAGFQQQYPYQQAGYPQQYQYPRAYVYPQPKKSHGGTIAAIIILAILFIGGFMIYKYFDERSPKSQYKRYKNKAENYVEDLFDW